MYKFKDFNIKLEINNFTGEKIAIKRIFNVEIKILAYKITPSIQKENSQLLTLQIEKQGEKRIVFTGSNYLIKQIKLISEDKFPFLTKIINDNEYFEFT